MNKTIILSALIVIFYTTLSNGFVFENQISSPPALDGLTLKCLNTTRNYYDGCVQQALWAYKLHQPYDYHSKQYCCAVWFISDCEAEAAEKGMYNCSPEGSAAMSKYLNKWNAYVSAGNCTEFTYHSVQCKH